MSEIAFIEIAFSDPERAALNLRDLAGNGVSDDDIVSFMPILSRALRFSSDPDRALKSFQRWLHAVSSPFSHLQILLNHPIALELFCQITGSSQYFAELLVRFPEYIEIVSNPGVRGGGRTTEELFHQLSLLVDACQKPELKRDVLRRWKAREMLRIGIRDLAGMADMPETSLEFSNLADACVQKALEIALSENPLSQEQVPIPFLVVAMGKLGGRELNYSSDIDLMFVNGDNAPEEFVRMDGRKIESLRWLSKISETIIKILADESANGHVFRVDMRLRPEGRFGPLVRSLESHRLYYESWAESWERQALLKARPIAGDAELSLEFMGMAENHVYRKHVSPEFLEEIRKNKRKIERKCELESQTESNIKTGFGGIRDIEFLIQAIQLEHGGMNFSLRTPNTLNGLNESGRLEYLTLLEVQELSDDYIFLRNLEHRLQLLHGFQTQTLPDKSNLAERSSLSRRMSFSSLEAFEMELQRRRERVRFHLNRRFYHSAESDVSDLSAINEFNEIADLLETIDLQTGNIRISRLLQRIGFRDVQNAIRLLRIPMFGNEYGKMPPDTLEEFRAITPKLMQFLSVCVDPDSALAGIEKLALAVPNRAQLYAAFDDSPELLSLLVALGASSPYLIHRLSDHLEWLDSILPMEDSKSHTRGSKLPTLEERRNEVQMRLKKCRNEETKLRSLSNYYLRETLVLGLREIRGVIETHDVMEQLADLADVVLHSILVLAKAFVHAMNGNLCDVQTATEDFAIIALGKLGGRETSHSSDWDILFVYDDIPSTGHGDFMLDESRYELLLGLTEKVLSLAKQLESYGARIELDLKLRPWGKKGAIIYSLSAYKAYFATEADVWERQAVMKARHIAGLDSTGGKLMQILQEASFKHEFTPEAIGRIVSMKHRIETERLKPEAKFTHLKLGYGGLSDIEWLVQKFQLQNAREFPKLITTNTIEALEACEECGLLSGSDSNAMISLYLLLSKLRNHLWLHDGKPGDTLLNRNAEDRFRLNSIARNIGYNMSVSKSAGDTMEEALLAQMKRVRTIFERDFFGMTAPDQEMN